MPIILSGGTNDNEDPILLGPDVLQSSLGAEYRSGRMGVFRAAGRKGVANFTVSDTSVSGDTWAGSYYAGYDDQTDWLVAQNAAGYKFGRIDVAGISLSTAISWGSNPDPVTGTHYGNRHYLVNGALAAAVVERDSAVGLTFRTIGMNAPSQTIGLSITQGTSAFSTTTGLIYWLTEYDSVRGIESVAGSTSASTGIFSSKTSVILTISGAAINPNADKHRIYRTNDGGVFPDGGMLVEQAIATTTYTDTYSNVSSLLTPGYGTIAVGELTFNRDEAPPVLSTIGSFAGGLLGFPANSRRELRYTPAGYPESWPSIYSIPLETHRHDIGMGTVEYSGSCGVFTRDTVHRLTRLPREVDSVFAPGEANVLVTDERGCISTRGFAVFSPPGSGPRIAFVARDGIWMTDLDSVIPLTDGVAWDTRVSVADLPDSVLINDPTGRRLVFLYRKVGEDYNTGVMYLDYQGDGVRITHGDHGPLSSACLAPYSGALRLFTTDSRYDNGKVYVEAVQDVDDSLLVDTDGSVHFKIRTAEYMPVDSSTAEQVGTASWLHSGGPTDMIHRFYYDGFAYPEPRTRDWSTRGIDDIGLNRTVNTMSLELESTSTTSFAVHYLDIEGIGKAGLGPSEGA